jgi:hypothetical protein
MGGPSALDDNSGAGYNKHAGDYKGYIAAEFTYPILPDHKGEIRKIDVKTLREVGKKIRDN